MYTRNIETLTEAEVALCERITHRAVNEWQLPVKQRRAFLGFGNRDGFYMFWISWRDNEHYFKARADYCATEDCPTSYYKLTPENEAAILAAMEASYRAYLAFCEKTGREPNTAPRRTHSAPSQPIFNTALQNSDKTTGSEAYHTFRAAATRAFSERDEACELIEELPLLAEEFTNSVNSLLTVLSARIFDDHARDVWRSYTWNGTKSMEEVGQAYGLTRQRVHQLVKRGNQRVKRLLASPSSWAQDGPAVITCLSVIEAVLERIGNGLVALLCRSTQAFGYYKKKFVFSLLFGEKNDLLLMAECKKYQKVLHHAANAEKAQEKVLDRIRLWQELAHFPEQAIAAPTAEFPSYDTGRDPAYVNRILSLLQKASPFVRVTAHPDIVYYATQRTDHRPTLLLRFADGRSVLLLILPVLNMAFRYNVLRIQALARFCEQNGYGYLVMDDRDQTFDSVKAAEVDEGLARALDEVLRQNNRILWPDIVRLKEEHAITNTALASFVLQRGIRLTTTPFFCIW